MNDEIERKINDAVQRARKKHPDFRKSIHEANTVLTSEVGEVSTAILRETQERVDEELYDTIAVCVRMLMRDYER